MAGTFTDTFNVFAVDMVEKIIGEKKEKVVVHEKQFDKVSRIEAKSENYDTSIVIDINSEIYPISEGDKIELLLTEQLNGTGTEVTEEGVTVYDPTVPLGSLADTFDYIMHGRIFKFAEEKSRAVIYISFGGLLMSLQGETRILNSYTYQVDSQVYLFIRKV